MRLSCHTKRKRHFVIEHLVKCSSPNFCGKRENAMILVFYFYRSNLLWCQITVTLHTLQSVKLLLILSVASLYRLHNNQNQTRRTHFISMNVNIGLVAFRHFIHIMIPISISISSISIGYNFKVKNKIVEEKKKDKEKRNKWNVIARFGVLYFNVISKW